MSKNYFKLFRFALMALCVSVSVFANSIGICRAAILGSGDVYPANPSTWTSLTWGTVGDTSTGTVTVDGGSELLSMICFLGKDTGSSGTVTVDGAKWTNADNIYIGDSGTGMLTVENGGLVSARTLYASPNDLLGNGAIEANGAITDGNLLFNNASGLSQTLPFGSGGLLTLNLNGTGDLGAGYKSSGTLQICDGLSVTSPTAFLGYAPGSSGAATISGAGTAWTVNGYFYVGYSGNGLLNIGNGIDGPVSLKIRDLRLAKNSSTITGTVNLNNGSTLLAGSITTGAGVAIFNWNDGVIRNYDANADLVIPASITMKIAETGTHSFHIDSGRMGLVYGRLVDATANASITKTGPGKLVLTGMNTYTGNTIINNGTLQANSGIGLPSTSFLILDGGVLQTYTYAAFTRPLGTGGNAFQWTENGGGFSAASNNFSVNIGGGTALTWGHSVGSQIVGVLKLSSATATHITYFQNSIDLGGEDRTIQVEDNLNATNDYALIAGNITNSAGIAGLHKIGSGKLSLDGTNSYNGTTIVDAGTLAFLSPNAMPTGSYIVNGGILEVATKSIDALRMTSGAVNGSGILTSNTDYDAQAGTISIRLAGSVGLNKTGPGKLTLSGTNSYTGNTTISEGVLQADYGFGLPNQSFLILDGGVLQSSSFGNSFTRPLGTSGNALQWSANGGGFSAGTYPLNVNIGNGTALTWGNNVSSQIVGTLKLSSATAESVTNFSNNIDLGGEDRSIQVEDNPNSINDYADMPGAITNTSGIAGIRKIGNGMLALTGTNSYNGTTTLDAGTLRFLAAVAMPTGAYVINDGTLDIIGITKSIAAFSINNGNIKGSGTLTSNSAYDAKAGSVNVRLGGIVGLDKSGSGTLTLSMANTYSGETVVEQGLLKITGSILNSSRVTVDAEGILELTKLSGSATAATVPIDNQGLLLISQGSHVVGTIAGNGITQIYPNATLIAHSIEQDTLIIGQAVSSNATALNAVPEPSTFALVLASLLTVLLAQFRRRMTP